MQSKKSFSLHKKGISSIDSIPCTTFISELEVWNKMADNELVGSVNKAE